MRLIVDRIEGEYAVCETEDLEIINIPVKAIPNVKEQDVIEINIIKKDNKKLEELMNKAFE